MDEHDFHRFPPSSSALIALSSLTPPSPILSSAQLSSTYSSQDIPIIFDLDLEALSLASPTSISQSSTIASIGTVDTFGPTRRNVRYCKASSSSQQEEIHTYHDQPSLVESGISSIFDSFSGYNDTALLTPISHRLDSVSHLRSALSDVSYSSEALSKTAPSIQAKDSCPPEGTGTGLADSKRQMAFAAALACLESRCDSAPSSPQPRRIRPLGYDTQSLRPHLPRHLAWLDKTIVEILIDQEGFRAALARFKFSGFIKKQSSGPTNDNHETALFRPTHRQAFLFHYAPIDSLPVLRRITLNGEDSRDYISRQASLGLKSNGVYAVRGNEVLSFHASQIEDGSRASHVASDSQRLCWKFEYLVDDRRTDLSGNKICDGEKILTPLSFSCSPLLLHPLQGKRIRLMHVVKKAVAPKLVAEKMEPPDIPFMAKTTCEPTTPGAETALRSSTKSYIWNMKASSPLKGKKVMAPANSIGQPNIASASPRRRRASSAGEHSRPEIRIPAIRMDYRNSHAFPIPSRPLLGRHIIPPERLAQMMDEES